MSDWSRLREPIEAALRALRPIVLNAFRAAPAPATFKDDGSAITALDLLLEQHIVETLLPLDDSFGLYSEEAGMVRAGNPIWHLDPLDGTANFVRRFGIFGTQIALMDGNEPVFSAIYEPLSDDFSWAAKGTGAHREQRTLRMPDCPPERARIYVDLSRTGIFHNDPLLLNRIRSGCYRIRALGSAAINLRDVAAGVADGYVGGRARTSPLHDLAPGTLLIREAGGLITDPAGIDALEKRRVVIAGAPQVHSWLCGLLRASQGA